MFALLTMFAISTISKHLLYVRSSLHKTPQMGMGQRLIPLVLLIDFLHVAFTNFLSRNEILALGTKSIQLDPKRILLSNVSSAEFHYLEQLPLKELKTKNSQQRQHSMTLPSTSVMAPCVLRAHISPQLPRMTAYRPSRTQIPPRICI